MNEDLFGSPIRSGNSIEKQYLLDKDKTTLWGRTKRLEYLHKLNPDGLVFSGDMELVFTYREAQETFIAGHFLSTIVLAQSFIEKLMQIHFDQNGPEGLAKKGLHAMLKYCQQNVVMHEFIVRRVNWLRLIRNPITHLKELEYQHRLDLRSYTNKKNPLMQLEVDAKEAISIMTFLAINGIKH